MNNEANAENNGSNPCRTANFPSVLAVPARGGRLPLRLDREKGNASSARGHASRTGKSQAVETAPRHGERKR